MTTGRKKPELLCPAGSRESLEAALEGGADAVYLGSTAFNARANARNFDAESLRNAVKLSHARGVKVYLTLNTLVYDREIPSFLDTAKDAVRAGVDALIVADIGGAEILHRVMPTLELHASTQMSGHNSLMAENLRERGFSRMVVAREISRENLKILLEKSPIETELFVHGALCVCHSGQCLFSSLVGGRSGNRGECAQPCRLPYEGKITDYPLSLKDLSLARHVPELTDMGVASFKIEGRMKPPEYVYEVAKTFRTLLDEHRGATDGEIKRLSQAFSRSGFTDGYYTLHIDRKMLGIRRDEDKTLTKQVEPFGGLTGKIPLSVSVRMTENEPIVLTLTNGERSVTVTGDIPQTAVTSPMNAESILKSLTKFGTTPYTVAKSEAVVGENLMLPVSRLNDLRRRAVAEFESLFEPPERAELPYTESTPTERRRQLKQAVLYSPEQLTDTARAYFDRIFLPLFRYDAKADGVVLPPVIFDRDIETVSIVLQNAKKAGAKYALVGNLGHLPLVHKADLVPVGDFRLNITNGESVAMLERQGIRECILSPELTVPQMRDIGGNTAVIVYGRIPLMVLEKCVGLELGGCEQCKSGKITLVDRRHVSFPVLREWEHRSVILNSLPTSMSDRQNLLDRANLNSRIYLFTTETPQEIDKIIHAFQSQTPTGEKVRRV